MRQYGQKNDQKALLNTYFALGLAHQNRYNYIQASRSFNLAERLADRLNRPYDQYRSLIRLGIADFWMDRYASSLDHLLKARNLSPEEATGEDEAELYKAITDVYLILGNYRQALIYQKQALESIDPRDSLRMGLALISVGNIYANQRQHNEALVNLNQAKTILSPSSHPQQAFDALAATASVLNRIGRQQEARQNINSARTIATALRDQFRTAFCEGVLANILREQGQLDEAESFYQNALRILHRLNIKNEYSRFLLGYAALYDQRGDYKTAIDSLEKALLLARQIDSRPLQQDAFKALANSFEGWGRTNTALAYIKRYVALRDTLDNEDELQTIANIETENQIQRQQKQIRNLELQRSRTQNLFYLYGGLILGGLLALLCWLIYTRYRSQLKSADLLSTKNRKISEQYERLAQTNEELRRFAEIASIDLQAPLQQIENHARKIEMGELPDQHVVAVRENLSKMDAILAGLSMYSVVSTKDHQPEEMEIGEIVGQAISNLPPDLRQQATRITMQNLPRITAYRFQMVQLFQHLISNAIKFRSIDDPEVHISGEAQGEWTHFQIRDNGRGIPAEFQQDIFGLFNQLDEENLAEGSGIGLAICKKIVEQHRGRIWVESAPNQGSTFHFTLAQPDE